MLNVEIAPGTYDEVEFEIHAVSGGDPAEVAFTDAHPEFVGVSIRAEGTDNGTSFTFETDMDQEQESEINPPLVIDVAGGSVNLTLRIDHTQWFSDGNGGLLDPATANHGGENEGVVEANIVRSTTLPANTQELRRRKHRDVARVAPAQAVCRRLTMDCPAYFLAESLRDQRVANASRRALACGCSGKSAVAASARRRQARAPVRSPASDSSSPR